MSTRDRILDAAEQVMRSDGLAKATTRRIAAAAGYSEATMYKHFASKEDLFLAVLVERLPPFVALIDALPDRGDDPALRQTLIDVAAAALAFYEQSMPLAGSILAQPQTLARHSEQVRLLGRGPHFPLQSLATWLRRQQEHGAIRPDADSDAVAALLLGACFQQAFLGRFAGEEPLTHDQRQAKASSLVTALLDGVLPEISAGRSRAASR